MLLGEAEDWSKDLTKWPGLEFGNLYTYLIKSKGVYMPESLDDEWYQQRQGRLAASDFHKIYAMQKQTNPTIVARRLLSKPQYLLYDGELIMKM